MFRAGAEKVFRARPKMFPGMLFFMLAIFGASAINEDEKQKMRQLLGLRPPKSLHRCAYHLHNGPRPHRMDDIIQFFPRQCKGFSLHTPARNTVFCRTHFRCTWCRRGRRHFCLLTCRVGTMRPARHFCFSPTLSGGARLPPGFPWVPAGKQNKGGCST